MDFETHVAAHLKDEIAQANGKSTSNPKRGKKAQSELEVDAYEESVEEDLNVVLPCDDDATDGDYVEGSDDDNDVADPGCRNFKQVRDAIVEAFWALLSR